MSRRRLGAANGVDIPAGSTIAPGGRLVVVLRTGDGLLNNGGDSATLYDAAGVLVDEVVWTTAAPGDRSLAVGETVILLTLPSPSLLKHLLKGDGGVQQNDSLADGDRSLARQPDGGRWASGWQTPSRDAHHTPTPPPPPPYTPRPAPAPAVGTTGTIFAAAGAPDVSCAAGTSQLAVATFNIQNIGATKVGRPAVMAALGAIAARYDILAVQELSQITTGAGCATQPSAPVGTAACGLLASANAAAGRARYGLAASPRVGNGGGQEQYALLFDTGKLVLEREAVYPDPDGLFVRDPWACRLGRRDGGSIVVVGLHTPPASAAAEIGALGRVLGWAAVEFEADAVLLLGDFNGDGSYFPRATGGWPALMASPLSPESPHSPRVGERYSMVAPDGMDSTVATSRNIYDRLLITTSWHAASVAAGGLATAAPYQYDTDPAMAAALSAVITEGCGRRDYFAGRSTRAVACATIGADPSEDMVCCLGIRSWSPARGLALLL